MSKRRSLHPNCRSTEIPVILRQPLMVGDKLRTLVAFKDGKPVATTSQPGPDCTIAYTGMTITPEED